MSFSLGIELGTNIGSVGVADPSAGYAFYYDPKNTVFRDSGGLKASSSLMTGYSYTRSGVKGEVRPSDWVTTLGPELVADYNTNPGQWTPTNGTMSVVNGQIRLTQTVGPPASGNYAVGQDTLAFPEIYPQPHDIFRFAITGFKASVANEGQVSLYLGNGGTSLSPPGTNPLTTTVDIVNLGGGQGVTAAIKVGSVGGSMAPGEYVEFTSLSVKRVFHGIAYFGEHFPGEVPGVGYWARGAVTNYQPYSQDLTNAAGWSASNAGRTANAAVAPNGTTTADLFYEDGTTSEHNLYSSGGLTLPSGSAVTHSVFAKQGPGSRFLQLWAPAGHWGTEQYANFDLTNGTVTQTNGNANIIACGNGWYRCVLRGTLAATTAQMYIQLVPLGTSAAHPVYAGDGASGVYLTDAQVMAGNFPDGGPIIPTAGATQALGLDALNLATPSMAVDHDFYVIQEAYFNIPAAGATYWLMARNPGVSQFFGFNFGGGGASYNFSATDGGSYVFTKSPMQAGRHVGIIRRKGGKWTAALKFPDGTTETRPEVTTAWAMSGITTFDVGYYSTDTINGYVERLALKDETLSDAAMAALLAAA